MSTSLFSRFALLGVVLSSILFGQGNLATVTGLVLDSSKAVVAGVKVTIRNADTNIEQTIHTNEDGLFTITGLAPGSYELTAS